MRRAALGVVVSFTTIGALSGSTSWRTPETQRRAAAQTVWDSVYSVNQAARGESSYARACARCHGAALTGGDQAPPLTGSAFLGNWNNTSLADLQTRIVTTMPSDSVGVYKRDVVTDVMAFMLKANGFPAGASELPADTTVLKTIELRTSR